MLSVLVVSPNPSVPGGVSVFIECMKRHVMHSKIDSFFVGSAGMGREAFGKTLARLMWGPIQLARRARKTNPDVVHINPSFDIKSLIRDGLFVLALRVIGYKRIYLYFHGWDFGVYERIQQNKALRVVLSWVLNKSTLITVLGDDFRKGLVLLGVKPSLIQVTRTMYESLQQSKVEACSSSRNNILFMSRFDHEKGARELVQAFAALMADYPTLDLILAGDGADAPFLRKLVEKLQLQSRVILTGYVKGAEKEKLLKECMIFALPTYYRGEGMPVAVLEAMGAGKPLLVGSAGALRSIVTSPENGVVLDSVTVEAVEAGLRYLLEQPDLCAAIGHRNAVTAANKFEASIVTAEIENLYQQVATC